MGRSKKFEKDQDILAAAKKVCDLYGQDRHTLRECLKVIKISHTTFYNWVNEFPAVQQLFQEAQKQKDQVYKVNLKERALTSLEKVVSGYEVKTTKKTYQKYRDKKTGRLKRILSNEVLDTKVFAPNVTAIIFALTNSDPQRWKSRQSQELTGADGKPLPYTGFNFVMGPDTDQEGQPQQAEQ